MSKEERNKMLNVILAVNNLIQVLDELDKDDSPDIIRERAHEVKEWIRYSFSYLTDQPELRRRIVEDIINERF